MFLLFLQYKTKFALAINEVNLPPVVITIQQIPIFFIFQLSFDNTHYLEQSFY